MLSLEIFHQFPLLHLHCETHVQFLYSLYVQFVYSQQKHKFFPCKSPYMQCNLNSSTGISSKFFKMIFRRFSKPFVINGKLIDKVLWFLQTFFTISKSVNLDLIFNNLHSNKDKSSTSILKFFLFSGTLQFQYCTY